MDEISRILTEKEIIKQIIQLIQKRQNSKDTKIASVLPLRLRDLLILKNIKKELKKNYRIKL